MYFYVTVPTPDHEIWCILSSFPIPISKDEGFRLTLVVNGPLITLKQACQDPFMKRLSLYCLALFVCDRATLVSTHRYNVTDISLRRFSFESHRYPFDYSASLFQYNKASYQAINAVRSSKSNGKFT